MKLNNEFLQENGVFVFRIILCVLSWIATIVLSIINSILISIETANIVYFFNSISYYTVQSNFLVLLWITVAVIYEKKEDKPFFLKPIVQGAITVYITFTFIVFALVLQPLAEPSADLVYNIRNILVHYLIPIMFIIDWVVTGHEEQYEWKYELYWLIYPLGYLAYTLIRGVIINWYPYFFFNFNTQGIPLVIIFSIALSLLFIFLIAVYIFVNRKLHARKNN